MPCGPCRCFRKIRTLIIECLNLTFGTLILRLHLQILLEEYALRTSNLYREHPPQGKAWIACGYLNMLSPYYEYDITAGECCRSCWTRTSVLLSQVGHVSKLPRLYLGKRPRRCTTTPSDPYVVLLSIIFSCIVYISYLLEWKNHVGGRRKT